MGEPRTIHEYTYAEYIALERVSPERHEFIDGEIYAMAGGSEEHSALAMMVNALLVVSVRPPCRVHGSDLRIYVESGRGAALFPDGSVICGPLQQHEPSLDATALNPTALVEVTSNSSEKYDRGLKRERYHTIRGLREYIVVSHRERSVSVDSRDASGIWTTRVARSGERFELPSLQVEIAVDDIYRNSTIA